MEQIMKIRRGTLRRTVDRLEGLGRVGVAALAAASIGLGTAFASTPEAAAALRVQWETDVPHDGLQAVCGRVFNDRTVAARRVILLVEGLDGTERVTSRRQVEVLGEVPSEGYAVFCVPEPVAAVAYRVRVVESDWMEPAEQ